VSADDDAWLLPSNETAPFWSFAGSVMILRFYAVYTVCADDAGYPMMKMLMYFTDRESGIIQCRSRIKKVM